MKKIIASLMVVLFILGIGVKDTYARDYSVYLVEGSLFRFKSTCDTYLFEIPYTTEDDVTILYLKEGESLNNIKFTLNDTDMAFEYTDGSEVTSNIEYYIENQTDFTLYKDTEEIGTYQYYKEIMLEPDVVYTVKVDSVFNIPESLMGEIIGTPQFKFIIKSYKEYNVTTGANGTINNPINTGYVIKTDGPIEELVDVEIDGNKLEKDKDYTVDETTEEIVLSNDYISKQPDKEYQVVFTYKSGVAKTKITIVNPKTNEQVPTIEPSSTPISTVTPIQTPAPTQVENGSGIIPTPTDTISEINDESIQHEGAAEEKTDGPPKTSDGNNIVFYLILMGMSVIGIYNMLVRKKR